MKALTKDTAKLYILLAIILAIATFFYLTFQNHQPKILKQIQEIKGTRTQREYIPYPKDSIKIASSKTSESTQLTFKTKKTPVEIQEFYKNIYLDDNWEIESETANENFLVIKFKKDKEFITVISSKQMEEEYMIASVEITKR